MGRLDEPAKKRIVELRRAGLSFRKIKAVLELDNVKVSAQAIYLYLKKEKKIQMEECSGFSWSDQQRPTGQVHQKPNRRAGSARNAWCPEMTRYGAKGQSGDVGNEEEEIKILNVTSLSENSDCFCFQRRGSSSQGGAGESETPNPATKGSPRVTCGTTHGPAVPSALHKTLLVMPGCRRVQSPAPRNATLMARRRLVEKAVLHKMKVSPAGAPNGPTLRSSGGSQKPSPPECCPVDSQQQQRALVSPTGAYAASGGPGVPHRHIASQTLGSSGSAAPSGPAHGCQTGTTATLPANGGSPHPDGRVFEKLETLNIEVRRLGSAVRLLTEQHGRLEREQAQQTRVQQQILRTLQTLAAALAPAAALNPAPCTESPVPGHAPYTPTSLAPPHQQPGPKQASSDCPHYGATDSDGSYDGANVDSARPIHPHYERGHLNPPPPAHGNYRPCNPDPTCYSCICPPGRPHYSPSSPPSDAQYNIFKAELF
ncbi:uncharacterized protein LOC114660942 isoform X2 [Erpetoichthys calabaricus]|uniref:uncharacterized protein LOC114660942 isoform X2 n=1 Tax=Erpetoichthys calabaricus TaxID=27687 RepID=UPI0010A02E01|nr:uncharacterized protein LOC114660942 isoform X2 [Erpetoichthys calabaricus]